MSPAESQPGVQHRVVVHVADVAGVATSLCEALDEYTSWHAERVALPTLGASSGGVAHALGRAVRAAVIPWRVGCAVPRVAADVVHLHWARFAPIVPRRGRPLIVHVHGSDVRNRTGRTATSVQHSLSKASAVLVSTPDLIDHVRCESIYLPNPIAVDTFRPGRPQTGGGAPTVLLFARLSDVKGADTLVETVRQLGRLAPEIRVLGISGGEYDDAAVAAGAVLLDPMSRIRIVELLQGVDVVVGQQGLGILSLSELEAMSCGRPVVVPLRPDLYPPDVPVEVAYGPDEIARAIVDLINDPERAARLGGSAREFVIDQHSHASVARRLAGVYDGVLADV